MKIIKISPEAIKEAGRVIMAGGLVVFPSDTIYILAVDPTNSQAVNKLLGFKNRWTGKAISIAVTDIDMAREYVVLNETAKNIYANLLPGPFTIVSEGKHKVATGIEAENGTLGIRIPDNRHIADLVKAVEGPVTATSANLSGRTPNYSVESFVRPLSKKKQEMIDLIVDGGKLPRNKPSTVVDTAEGEIKILRRGDLVTGEGKTLVSKSEKETGKIAEFLMKKLMDQAEKEKAVVWILSGDLGTGKTVFSRHVGRFFGVEQRIVSPTFVIYNEYEIKKEGLKKFVHFDLYRLEDKYEYEEIKFLDQFDKGVVACVEWPENMGKEYLEKLSKIAVVGVVKFEYLDENTRKIEYSLA